MKARFVHEATMKMMMMTRQRTGMRAMSLDCDTARVYPVNVKYIRMIEIHKLIMLPNVDKFQPKKTGEHCIFWAAAAAVDFDSQT